MLNILQVKQQPLILQKTWCLSHPTQGTRHADDYAAMESPYLDAQGRVLKDDRVKGEVDLPVVQAVAPLNNEVAGACLWVIRNKPFSRIVQLVLGQPRLIATPG